MEAALCPVQSRILNLFRVTQEKEPQLGGSVQSSSQGEMSLLTRVTLRPEVDSLHKCLVIPFSLVES